MSFFVLREASAAPARTVSSPYLYNFNQDGVLSEAGSDSESASPYWWLNSGGYMTLSGGRGSTNIGLLAASDLFRFLYSVSNPNDTDDGFRPQNIFRLLTRSAWQNARQEAYFIIKEYNEKSLSDNRNQSNGILFFNRYQDGDNLYYTGIRVDGSAIIKKKSGGIYYTLASSEGIYPGIYDRDTSPSLLPQNKWIGLRSEVVNNADGSVSIRLFIDKGWSGRWTLIAEIVDRGEAGGIPITTPGRGGIRTDFMDIEFENYRMTKI